MQIIKTKKLTWIDIREPKDEDLNWLKKKFNLHPLVLKELLPPIDQPKIENFGKYLFIVLFYPFFSQETFQTVPFELDIIISKKYIITNHYKNIVPLKAIFDKCNLYEEAREEYMGEGSGRLLCHIVQNILTACLPKLSHIKKNIDEAELEIYKKKYEKAVHKIALIKRDIIGFQRIIEPLKIVIENLTRESQKLLGKSFIPYFHNLKNLYDKVQNILDTHSKTISSFSATNESLLATRTNQIMKLLTIFSVIVFPLSLLASMFGMNTSYLPFVGGPYDFWIVVSIMIFGVLVMLVIFKTKKWI